MRLFLLAALVAAPAFAQDAPADTVTIMPGDPSLVTDWVTAGSSSYTMRLTAPMQQDVGTMTESISVEDGRIVRVTTMEVPMQGMTQTDSLVATTAFFPLTHNSEGGAADASLEFMDEGVVGMVTPMQGENTTVMLMTDTPVFDGGWIAEIARSVPLTEGAVYLVPTFMTQMTEDVTNVILTVGGQEDVDGTMAQVIEGDLGPVGFTYLVDPETRALLATRFSPQPGVSLEITPDE
ncbi:hypothetical protein [Rubrivirga sp.]|uniref:hypothetical protein n=1 Tax=Rubrivirga sp. TaxID=1885344 RepID=UPI003C782673